MTTPSLIAGLRAFFAPLKLPADARRTFRFHWAYAMLDAIAGGILLNACRWWRFGRSGGRIGNSPSARRIPASACLSPCISAVGCACAGKMPFVFIPGMLAGFSALAMALAVGNAFLFLTLFGVGAMLEITTRPGSNRHSEAELSGGPTRPRDRPSGQWSSLFFVVSNLGAAYVLQQAGLM